MRWIVVVASLALVACPRDPPADTTATTTMATTGGTSGSATTEVPTGGGESTGTSGGGSSGTTTTATTEAIGSTGPGSSSPGAVTTEDPSTTSSGSTSDDTTGTPPLLFDCYGCLCDANVHYCQQVFTGFKGPEPRLCPVVRPDSGDSGCVVFPADCGGLPSCSCLPQMEGDCFCTEVDGGVFEVICPLP